MIRSELKQLVFHSVKLLGEAFRDVYGEKAFLEIESLRLKMKKVRGKNPKIVQKCLDEVYQDLQKNKTPALHQKAKAFALMLEVINACEVAYRSFRLKQFKITTLKKPDAIIYVFTGHPTEARSQNFLKIMNHIEDLLFEALQNDFDSIRERLFYFLKIAVGLNLANTRRPQVKDEMDQIFHTVLDGPILREQIRLNKKNFNVSFRTWVGGDKDGHPKVGAHTMLESWGISRKKLLEFIDSELKIFEEEIPLLNNPLLKKEIVHFKKTLRILKVIQENDGKKVSLLKIHLEKLKKASKKDHLLPPFITSLEKLLWYYPALVLPLEIREDSGLIKKALKDKEQPIISMLKTLKSISHGMDPKWYARGFIISMCMTSQDMLAAISITKKVFGKLAIPVVPLFENEKGLTGATTILEETFRASSVLKDHQKKWRSRFEVMVGYSDSSKENGVLPARLMLEEGLHKIEKYLISKKLTPVFFHGSGGSTSRGGGSVREQISWWPKSALNVFKVTIQGEMVQRNFTNSLIMRSQVGKVVKGFSECCPTLIQRNSGVEAFSASIQSSYKKLVADPSFHQLISAATPYDFLDLLKIGSRPTKRKGKGTFSLRAIPWILCWTQTRLLLPVWWGTGSAWSALSAKEKKSLILFSKKSPLMQSYLKSLGFTLAKIELGVWNFYLDHGELSDKEKAYWKKEISKEYELATGFFKEVVGEDNFTWFRPWLGESILFRSSMIHPLNVIQKLSLERKDPVLLRETVTGIASGMLTTG